MDLNPYIETVRTGVVNAASLADDQTRHVAERLGGAIDSATRLALIQALSDAAGSSAPSWRRPRWSCAWSARTRSSR